MVAATYPDGLNAALAEKALVSVEADGADIIVLGCTGFLGCAEAMHAALLSAGHDVPVIDPVPITVHVAEALAKVGLSQSKRAYPVPDRKPIGGYDLPGRRGDWGRVGERERRKAVITLYGTVGPNVAKTRAGLILKELPYSQVEVDIVSPSEDFARLTPVKRIPVLRDGDLVVHDSLFIAEYLDRAYSDTHRLLPVDLESRVRAYTIMALLERAFTTIAPMVATRAGFFALGEERAARSGYHAVSGGVERALLREFAHQMAYLEKALDGQRRFFAGETTQADIAVFAFLDTARQAGLDTGDLERWRATVESEMPFDTMFECPPGSVRGAI